MYIKHSRNEVSYMLLSYKTHHNCIHILSCNTPQGAVNSVAHHHYLVSALTVGNHTHRGRVSDGGCGCCRGGGRAAAVAVVAAAMGAAVGGGGPSMGGMARAAAVIEGGDEDGGEGGGDGGGEGGGEGDGEYGGEGGGGALTPRQNLGRQRLGGGDPRRQPRGHWHPSQNHRPSAEPSPSCRPAVFPPSFHRRSTVAPPSPQS